MAYGLTNEGFVAKTLQEIKAEIEEDQRTEISPSINTSSASVIGQLNGIFAAKLREIWELGQAIYSASYPDTASGLPLRLVGAITGTTPRSASKSYLTASVTLNAGTTLPVGSAASVVDDPTTRFVTTEEVSNLTGSPAVVAVHMEAETTGPIVANAGTLTVIATPVSGWTAVTNAEDAVLGSSEESDTEFRQRREAELRASGSSTLDALRADLLTLAGMVDISVFENVTNSTDGTGLPPKSFEAVIFDGTTPALDDDVIAQRIWSSKPAGIRAYGVTSGTAIDSIGLEHTVGFSRATVVDVWMTLELLIDPVKFPVDGIAQIKAALVNLSDELQTVGEDVIAARYYAAIMGTPGVLDIQVFELGLTELGQAPGNLAIGTRQIADLDTGRIAITTVSI